MGGTGHKEARDVAGPEDHVWRGGSRGRKTLAREWLCHKSGQTVITQPGKVLAPK